MPNYDYVCSACHHKMEVFQKLSEASLDTCPNCQKKTFHRRPGGVGLGFSQGGDGFYSNMYGPKPPQEGGGGCCPCGKSQGSCEK